MTAPKRKKPRRRRQAAAAELVEQVLTRYGLKDEVREQRLHTRWRDVVGERIAARAWPEALKAGVLHVRVATSSWLHELSFLRAAVVASANEVMGAPLVREVRLYLGTRPPAERPPAPRPTAPPARLRPAPSAKTLARIDAEATRVADGELREVIRSVRRRIGF